MKSLTESLCSQKYSCIPIIIWLFGLLFSLFWNLNIQNDEREKIALQGARSLSQFVISARSWNASHEAIYATETSSTLPNPYINMHLRDLQIDDNLSLTKVTPDHMIRLISEFMPHGNYKTQFRITSLNPLRAENKANTWETKALNSFKNGKSEFGFFRKNTSNYNYHYMAPLYADETCLSCHGKQGYEAGDICGGISITLPLQKTPNDWPLILTHILVAVVGVVLIRFLYKQLLDSQERMELLASRDSLTGVANRRFFLEYLRREWLRAKRQETSMSFIMCDIDLFKQYNTTYGHQAGDNCLAQVAETISSVLHRPGDFVARYDGVRFAIILPETPIEGAEILAHRMLHLVEELNIEHLPSLASKYVTVSIGVTDNTGLSSSNEIIAQANIALNQAKEMGRNRVVRFLQDEEDNS